MTILKDITFLVIVLCFYLNCWQETNSPALHLPKLLVSEKIKQNCIIVKLTEKWNLNLNSDLDCIEKKFKIDCVVRVHSRSHYWNQPVQSAKWFLSQGNKDRPPDRVRTHFLLAILQLQVRYAYHWAKNCPS